MSATLPPDVSASFAEAFVAASALLGRHDVVAALAVRVPLAAALVRARDRRVRAQLLADAAARVAVELSETRPT